MGVGWAGGTCSLFYPPGNDDLRPLQGPPCTWTLEPVTECTLCSGGKNVIPFIRFADNISCNQISRAKGGELWEITGQPDFVSLSEMLTTWHPWPHLCSVSLPRSLDLVATRTTHSCMNAHWISAPPSYRECKPQSDSSLLNAEPCHELQVAGLYPWLVSAFLPSHFPSLTHLCTFRYFDAQIFHVCLCTPESELKLFKLLKLQEETPSGSFMAPFMWHNCLTSWI